MGNAKASLRFPTWPQQGRAGKFVVHLSQAPLETPRLRLRPVIGKGRIDLAFELIQLAGIKAGLQLPKDLSNQSFRSKLVGDEPFALFLVEEKAGGELVGLVGVWAISPSRGWPQVLYAVRPEFRGRGFAPGGHGLWRSRSHEGFPVGPRCSPRRSRGQDPLPSRARWSGAAAISTRHDGAENQGSWH